MRALYTLTFKVWCLEVTGMASFCLERLKREGAKVKYRDWVRRAAIVAVFACSGSLARAGDVADSPAARIDRIFEKYASSSAPGCAVGVFERGKLTLFRGYGVANVITAEPFTADTLFYAASVSKQFTALAVALLADEGKLSLEDDVRKWIPELPNYGTPITVAMLMHHTSGVRDFLGLLDLAGVETFDQLDVPKTLRLVAAQRGLDFTPGTKHQYSNGGYFLLGQVVARASGEPLHEFAKRRILEPLGMQHAFFRNGSNPRDANVSHGYVEDGKSGFQLADGYPSISGSGGLMISMNDLGKYDHDFHVGHNLWTEGVREIMLSPGTLANGERFTDEYNLHYAGGLSVGNWRGQQFVSHGGGATGFSNYYLLLPALKFSVAAFCNRGDADPAPMTEKIAEAYRGSDLRLVESMLGSFRSEELDAEYTFTREGEGLKLTITSAYARKPFSTAIETLMFQGGDVLTLPIGNVQLEYGADGQVSAFTTQGGELGGLRFVRISIPADLSPGGRA
jgi:CubicO group peptidase (beta-lactamase class C family)